MGGARHRPRLVAAGDFLSVYAAKGAATQGADARVSLLLRGMMIAGLMAALLSGCRVSLAGLRRTILFAFVLCATLGSFVLGMLTGHELLEQMVFALKVFTFFVYPAAMLMLSDRRLAQIESVVFVSLLVYGLSIVIGASLSIDMFRSYQADTQIARATRASSTRRTKPRRSSSPRSASATCMRCCAAGRGAAWRWSRACSSPPR